MLPDDKKQRALADIRRLVAGEEVDLLSMQKLMGRLNDVSLMYPYHNGFKRPLLEDLSTLQSMKGKSLVLSNQSRRYLLPWAGRQRCLASNGKGATSFSGVQEGVLI